MARDREAMNPGPVWYRPAQQEWLMDVAGSVKLIAERQDR